MISQDAEGLEKICHLFAWEVSRVGEHDLIDSAEISNQGPPSGIFAAPGHPGVIDIGGHNSVTAALDGFPQTRKKFFYSSVQTSVNCDAL